MKINGSQTVAVVRRAAPGLVLALLLLTVFLLPTVGGQGGDGRVKPTPTPRPTPRGPRVLPTPRPTPRATPRATPRPTPRPQQVTNRAGMEFVWVPPGEFMMGSENGHPSEKPVHRVTISEGFYLGKYEVTWAQWRQVMGGRGAGFDNYPVDGVTWDGAQEFIKRLNASGDGFTYRLPSESEWEYAARAGAAGDAASNLDDVAWYVKNSGREELKEEELSALDEQKLYDRLRLNMNSAHPVEGTKGANAFGLYHMLGNVREWVEDWYHETYEGAPADGRAWVTGGAQRYRVLRGGAAIDGASTCRFTTRMEFPAAASYVPYTFCGFRVVARPHAGRFILGLTTR